MASASIVPDKFDSGDFIGWLRDFNCCATANNWKDDDKLRKLPAFLKGPAAAHFYCLSDEQKESFAELSKNLTAALCPKIDREKYYTEFECRRLRPNEDPSLLLWNLEDLLRKADPELSKEAKTALLERQLIKCLPHDVRLRLLESNPTPSLKDMRDFVQRYRAVHHHNDEPSTAFASRDSRGVAPFDQLSSQQEDIKSLTAAIAALSHDQQEIKAVLQAQPQQQQTNSRWRPRPRRAQTGRCFNCNQVGHFANSCPWDPHCSVCRGWGHSKDQCPNPYLNVSSSSSSLTLFNVGFDLVQGTNLLQLKLNNYKNNFYTIIIL